MVAKWSFYGDMLANAVANNPFYQPMFDECARLGLGVKAPTPYELFGPLLDNEEQKTDKWIESLRNNWETYGLTIMCDGWTCPTKMHLINFMIYCDGQTIFHKTFDASSEFKDHKYIYKELKQVINDVGVTNVVQKVTDNGSAFVKVGKKLMKRRKLFWTPCACHCIDLILKDIGKSKKIRDVVANARSITNYIYNHCRVFALMRETFGRDIVRPGPTRFASNYIALQSLQAKRYNLKVMFNSAEWFAFNSRTESSAQEVEKLINKNTFWRKVQDVVDIMEPILKVFRMVDGDKKPIMGYMHRAMEWMMQQLQAGSRITLWVTDIVNERWNNMLTHPLLGMYFKIVKIIFRV